LPNPSTLIDHRLYSKCGNVYEKFLDILTKLCVRFANPLVVWVTVKSTLNYLRFRAEHINVFAPFLSAIFGRKRLPAATEVLSFRLGLFGIHLTDRYHIHLQQRKEIGRPLLKIRIVTDVNNAFLECGEERVEAFATRNALSETTSSPDGLD
jgi:hypothetical protein